MSTKTLIMIQCPSSKGIYHLLKIAGIEKEDFGLMKEK